MFHAVQAWQRRHVAATTADEPVLAGAAILGAMASGAFPDHAHAMTAMTELGVSYRPNPAMTAWHNRRSQAFGMLQATARAVRTP